MALSLKHQITVEEVQQAMNYEHHIEVAGSYGNGNHKCLDMVVKNGSVKYQVVNHRERVFESESLVAAVEVYNKL